MDTTTTARRPPFHPIRFIVSARGTTTKLALIGDIDLVNRLILEEAIDAAATCGGSAVDLDLAAVTSLDAAAVEAIAVSAKRLRTIDVDMTISNVPPAAREILRGSPISDALITEAS